MKKAIWIALALAVGVGGYFYFAGRKKTEPKYRTAKVDIGNVTQTVTATGTLSAVITVKVGSVVSGIVAALHADFNKQVKKGEILAELDPIPFQAKVDQTNAALEKSRVDVRNAEIGLRRQKALEKDGLAPQADLDQAQANFDSAVASVNQAKATVDQATTDLSNSKIIAPIDGVVVDREYDVGQSVAASFTAPTIFTIAQDLTKMQVSADVSESDIGMCKVGQPVRFTVDAYPEQTFRGTISQIRLNATVNQNVVTYPVIIDVPNPDMELRPNMTANVTIDVAVVKDVLRIPNSSLRFRPDEKDAPPAAERAAAPGATGATGATGGGPGAGPGAGSRGSRGGSPGGGANANGGPAAAAGRQFDRTTGGKAKKQTQTVYTIRADGMGPLKAVEIRAGITDGRFTQVVSGELKAGDTVVVGLATAKAEVSGSGPGAARSGGPGAPGGRRF